MIHRALVADPPWKFSDTLPGSGRGAAKHYPCMSLKELTHFPLPELAPDAILFLWRVAAMPQEAIDLAQAWDFKPKSEIVWVKTGRANDPNALAFGMGHYVRAAHETCLVCTRGRPKVRSRSVRSVFYAPRGRHSAKPDAFYDLVERLTDGPRAEIFARTRRKGWTQFGNELEAA